METGLIVRYWVKRPWWQFWNRSPWAEDTVSVRTPRQAKLKVLHLRGLGLGARIEYNGEIVTVSVTGKLEVL